MALIGKLQVQGIRSFGPNQEDRQNIQFYNPLTLILGQNGCGKTTIIECLKYVTTGDVPPGCGTGGPFIHDPKMAREAAVKGKYGLGYFLLSTIPIIGQVKLLFTSGDNVNIISRWNISITKDFNDDCQGQWRHHRRQRMLLSRHWTQQCRTGSGGRNPRMPRT